MTGFCKDCGQPLTIDGRCTYGPHEMEAANPGEALDPATQPSLPVTRDPDPGPFPKPPTLRRLLGSGIEYLAYIICTWVITVLDIFTAGLLGLFSFFLVCLIVLRDFRGGTFSIAKRVSQMRVVDRRTGQAASNIQALLRNGYYLVLLLIAAVFPWIDWLSSTFFMMFVALDVMMILASRYGRRLGDILAGTQVVEERS